jgi:hypothetical protein
VLRREDGRFVATTLGRLPSGDVLAGPAGPGLTRLSVHQHTQSEEDRQVRLRDVELSDVDAYIKMRCDPAMMAELGGLQPRDGIEDKVPRDVQDATSDTAWIKMIVPDEAAPEVVPEP